MPRKIGKVSPDKKTALLTKFTFGLSIMRRKQMELKDKTKMGKLMSNGFIRQLLLLCHFFSRLRKSGTSLHQAKATDYFYNDQRVSVKRYFYMGFFTFPLVAVNYDFYKYCAANSDTFVNLIGTDVFASVRQKLHYYTDVTRIVCQIFRREFISTTEALPVRNYFV